MKIGLLTLHWVPNFGANLQAFATTRYLQSLGHEVVVLNYQAPHSRLFHAQRVVEQQFRLHKNFCKQVFPETRLCSNESDVLEVAEQSRLDAVVVGSDALLRVNLSSEREDLRYPNPYWGDWCERAKLKVIGLSVSSMGTQLLRMPLDVRRSMAQDLRSWSALAARDRWTRLQMMALARRTVKLTADPVCLINSDDIASVEGSPVTRAFCQQSDPYIAVSFRPNHAPIHWLEEFKKVVNAAGYLLVSFPHPNGQDQFPCDIRFEAPISPPDWYRVIANANGVVTELFHPTAIAIFNNVPFLAVDNYCKPGKGMRALIRKFSSKTWDICHSMGLAGHCVPSHHLTQRRPPRRALDELLNFPRDTLRINGEIKRRELQDYLRISLQIIGE